MQKCTKNIFELRNYFLINILHLYFKMEVSSIDVGSSCRTCLLTSQSLEPLFETLFENTPLSQIVTQLSQIEIDFNDKLSHRICELCVANAINAYKFQQMCISNDLRVRQSLESQLKYDIDSDNIKTEEGAGNEILQDDLVEASLGITLGNESNDVMIAELKQLDEEYENETPNDSQDDSDDDDDSSDSDDGSSSKSTKFTCDECNKSFKSNDHLEQHKMNIHETSRKSKSAGSEDNESSDDEDDDSTKTFCCDACPKKFKKPSLLARHVKTHDPNRRPHEWYVHYLLSPCLSCRFSVLFHFLQRKMSKTLPFSSSSRSPRNSSLRACREIKNQSSRASRLQLRDLRANFQITRIAIVASQDP